MDVLEILDSNDESDYAGTTTRRRANLFSAISRPNYLNYYDDYEFKRRFRLSKPAVYKLIQIVQSKLPVVVSRPTKIPVEIEVLVALRFYAAGIFQIVDGDLNNISQPAISNIVKKISEVIAGMSTEYINFPSIEEQPAVKQKFYEIAGFPKVIGAIDGVHIDCLVPACQIARYLEIAKIALRSIAKQWSMPA